MLQIWKQAIEEDYAPWQSAEDTWHLKEKGWHMSSKLPHYVKLISCCISLNVANMNVLIKKSFVYEMCSIF